MGGVGQSGTGSYHGYYSFKTFSHQRTIAKPPNWADSLLRVRYMPYSWPHLKRFQLMNSAKPNFDRQGKQVKGLKYLVGLVLRLGGKSSKGALLRWAVLVMAALAVGVKNGSLNLGQWLAK